MDSLLFDDCAVYMPIKPAENKVDLQKREL